jgi:hypothetical protein
MEASQASHRAAALGLAEYLGREVGEPVEVELVGSAIRHVGVGAACELVCPCHRKAGRGERA